MESEAQDCCNGGEVAVSLHKLYEIAHSRSGDKGEMTNISLIPYKEEYYELIRNQITEEAVKKHFREMASTNQTYLS